MSTFGEVEHVFLSDDDYDKLLYGVLDRQKRV